MTAKALATCMLLAAQTYQVPPAVLIGIMHVENGRVGQQVGPNINGTYDLGPMQVNSRWVPQLADAWNVDRKTAYSLVRDDGCVNVRVSAWILRQKIKEAGSLYGGIAYYHSATPGIGTRYAAKVIAAMERKGLIRRLNTAGYTKKDKEDTQQVAQR
ncbi:MAG: transglycosylase [Proteobacteria bacterium]|nr:transglycosylase [Pseudomonadota bacterium]